MNNYREQLKLNEEVDAWENQELKKEFNEYLKGIFSPMFYVKIDRKFSSKVSIIKMTDAVRKFNNDAIAFTTGGNVIQLNFDLIDEYASKNNLSEEKKHEMIQTTAIHEFMHLLQLKRRFIFSEFKEINKLTKKLKKVLRKHLKGSLSLFLTRQEQDLGNGGNYEILAYLMNSNINWGLLTPKGRSLFINTLRESGIFNLTSKEWRKRLP